MPVRPASARSRMMGVAAALCVAPAVTLAIAPAPPAPVHPLAAALPTADHLDAPMLPPPAAAIHDTPPPPPPVPPTSPPPAPPVAAAPHPVTRAVAVHAPPPVPASDHGSIRLIITTAALAHGVDPAWMLAIATCESGLNPRAVEPHGHYGLFQFLPSTYAGNGGRDLWNPVEQAAITARMLAHGQAWQWACAHR